MTFFRRELSILFLSLMILLPLAGQDTVIKDYYPCDEGSFNEQGLVSLFEKLLTEKELPYQIITYTNKEERHSFSRSLVVDFNPLERNRLYLAFSLNGSSPLSYINGQIFYTLIEKYSDMAPSGGITLLILGGERSNPPVGSSDFLQDFTREETSTLLYFDIKDAPLILESSIQDYNAPYWLLRAFSQSLVSSSCVFQRDDMRNILSRTGLSMDKTLISPWLEREIPSLLLTGKDGTVSERTPEEITRNLVNSILDFTQDFDSLEKDNQERNYLPFSLGYRHFILGETGSLQLMIVLISLFILIIVFQSRNFRLNLKRNRRNLWVLGLIFSLVFIFLYLSTLIIEEIVFLKNIEDLWLRMARDILFFKLLLALLFSSFFLFILRGLPMPRTPHYYSYGAVLFAMANMVILVLKDFTLIYYSLWLYICLFLFLLTRKIIIKTIITIILPIPMMIILTTIVINSYPDLTGLFLLDRIGGNLIITTFLMPQILLLTSLHFSRYYYHRERRSYTALAVFILVPAALFLIILRVILFDPTADGDRQLIQMDDRLDYSRKTRTISVSSPRALGKLDMVYNGKTLTLNNLGTEVTIQEQMDYSYLSYSGEMQTFLDRKRLQLTIEPVGYPENLEILLYSTEGSLTVYDCNFPYFPNSDNKQVSVEIGKNPQFPLKFDLTLTADSKPLMRIIMTYETPPLEAPEIRNKSVNLVHTMTLIHELDLSRTRATYAFPATGE